MVSQRMFKFNRYMALIVGGIVGIGLLIAIIASLIKGEGFPPFGTISLMLIAISSSIWGLKELKKNHH